MGHEDKKTMNIESAGGMVVVDHDDGTDQEGMMWLQQTPSRVSTDAD